MARSKKYNPNKHKQSANKNHIQNHALVFVQGLPYSITYNLKSQIMNHQITREMNYEILSHRHEWNVVMGVLCRNEYGSDVLVQDILTVDSPVLQSDIFDVLNDAHLSLVDECAADEKLTVLRFGWVAYPGKYPLTDEQTYTIFNRLRGFNDEIFPKPDDTAAISDSQCESLERL